MADFPMCSWDSCGGGNSAFSGHTKSVSLSGNSGALQASCGKAPGFLFCSRERRVRCLSRLGVGSVLAVGECGIQSKRNVLNMFLDINIDLRIYITNKKFSMPFPFLMNKLYNLKLSGISVFLGHVHFCLQIILFEIFPSDLSFCIFWTH